MKIEKTLKPLSSFLSIEKDLNIILTSCLQNERLKRLLYRTTSDCLTQKNLSQQETMELLGKNLKLVPKLYVDNEVLNYIIVVFDNFYTNLDNPEFRNNTITFHIINHYSQWQLQDLSLRPYKIAAELDSMFNGKYLTGIGRVEFNMARLRIYTDEFAGVDIVFNVIHGEEDHKKEQTIEQQNQFEKDFKELLDNGYSLSAYGRD